MLERLLQLPGVQTSASLGHVFAVLGRVDDAKQAYCRAWKQGDIDALWGLTALLCGGPQNEDDENGEWETLTTSVFTALRDGTLTQDEAFLWTRIVATWHTATCADPGEGLEIWLRFLAQVPEASFPITPAPTSRTLGSDRWWREALDSIWQHMGRVSSGPALGYLALKHHHLVATCPDEGIRRDRSRLEWAGSEATGATHYLALRYLDRVLDVAPELVEHNPFVCSAGGMVHAYFRILEHLQDPRERAVYAMRYLNLVARKGSFVQALEGWQELQGHGHTLDAVLREHAQRMHIVQGHWEDAGHSALERAAISEELETKSALVLLGLEYMRHAERPLTSSVCATIQTLLQTLPHDMPASLILFEILEGALLAKRDVDGLLQLWDRSPNQHVLGTFRNRHVERQVLHWSTHKSFQGIDFASFEHLSPLRLWLLLTARQTTDTATIIQWISSAPTRPQNAHERLLSSLFILLHHEVDHPTRRKALEDLTRRFQEDVAQGHTDLLLYYVVRHAWELEGDSARILQLTALAAPQQPKPIAAYLQCSLARDLLALGEVERALQHARRAFRLDPLDVHVRDILRDAAEAADSEPDRQTVSNIIDDTELSRRMGTLSQWRALYATLESKLEGPPAGKHSAVVDLESMASAVRDPALRSALLRRATELSLNLLPENLYRDHSSPHTQRALRLARTCATTSPQDPLALHAALFVFVRLHSWEDAVQTLENRPPNTMLSAEMADVLFQSARICASHKDTSHARRLFVHAFQSAELYTLHNSLLSDLETAQELFADDRSYTQWRDLLETLLKEDLPLTVSCELHRRLGALYMQDLPDAERAVVHLTHALQSHATRPYAYQTLKEIYGRDGRYLDFARILFERAEDARHLAQKGADPSMSLLLAEHLFTYAQVLAQHLQDPHKALDALREVLTLQPHHMDALKLTVSLNRMLHQHVALSKHLHVLLSLERDPMAQSALLYELGTLSQMMGEDPQNTVSYYTKSLTRSPLYTEAYDALRGLLEDLEDWPSLWDLFERTRVVLERSSDSSISLEQLHSDRARIAYAHLGKAQESAASFLEALRINPHEGRYLQMLEIIASSVPIHEVVWKAQELRMDALPKDDPERRSLMYAHARLLLHHKREDKAIDVYREILAVWPDDLKAAEYLETAYKGAERWTELIAFYQDRLLDGASVENVVPVYWAIAHVAERKLRDVDMAIETYAQILDVDPNNVDVLRSLGRLLEATRQWERLIEISKREVELTERPKLKAHIYFRIGSLYETSTQNDTESIAYYERAIAQDGRCAPALHGLREIYRRQERWGDVIETLRSEGELWKEPREQASIFTRIAEIHHRHLHEYEAAERLLSKALRLSPDLASALEEYLDLMLVQERWRDAEKFAFALTRKSESLPSEERATLFFKRAQIAQNLGHSAEAIASLRIALDLNPHHLDALHTLLDLFSDTANADVATLDNADHMEFLGRLEKQLVERADLHGQATLLIYRGSLAEKRLDLEESIALYARAAALLPTNIPTQRPLVRLWITLRRFESVESHWRSVLKRTSLLLPTRERSEQLTNRVAILLEVARLKMDWMDQPDQALVRLLEAQRLQPRSEDVLWMSCQCYALLQRWSDALRTVDRLLALLDGSHPNAGRTLYYRGFLLDHGLQREDEALQAYSRSRDLNRTDPRPTLGAARILERRGDWIRLESLLRSSIPSTPHHDIPVRLVLARVYEERSERAKARSVYSDLLAIPEVESATRQEVHVALSRLSAQPQESRDALDAALMLNPFHREALSARTRLVVSSSRERVWLTSLMEAFGWNTAEDTAWLQHALGQHAQWRSPIVLKGAVQEELSTPATRGPEFAGLRALVPILRRLSPSTPPPPPSHPIQHPHILREYTALSSWLSLPSPPATIFYQDPKTIQSARFFNVDAATTRTLFALHGASLTSSAPSAIRAQCAWVLAFHALDASAWCMRHHTSIQDGQVFLGVIVELLVRLQEGESLPGLRREKHLRSLVRRLQASDVAVFSEAVDAMHAIAMAQSVTRDPDEDASHRARCIQDGVEDFAANAALLASCDPSFTIDFALSRWAGVPYTTHTPEKRLKLCKGHARAESLVRFAIRVAPHL